MPDQMLRRRGVYRLLGAMYAALPNEDDDDDYAFVLADVELRGEGYVLKEDQDFSLFVDKDGTLFSVYANDKRANRKTFRSLKETGLTVPERQEV